jgi:hypothetical protein
MKGLEETLEKDEAEIEFRKKVTVCITLIVFGSATLVKEIYSYVMNKIE